jgi:hypothetical protein
MAIIKQDINDITLQIGDTIEYKSGSWSHVGTVREVMDNGVGVGEWDFVSFGRITCRVVNT